MAKSKNTSVKVGDKAKSVEKKEKKDRPVFNLKKALDDNGNEIALKEGRLTAIPVNVPDKCKGLKRNSFSTKTIYAEYQLYLLHKQSEKLAKKITDKEGEIKDLKSGGDPKMKKLRRVKKLRAQVNALLEALKADGIDPAELGLDDDGDTKE